MAFDAVRGKVVMFGGMTSETWLTLSDMWEWDGVDWTQLHPRTVPSGRRLPGFAAYEGRGQIVMFGGMTALGTVLSDTWVWDGQDWRQQNPAHVPQARCCGLLAYCANSDGLAMYGGAIAGFGWVSDATTWEWNGSDWSGHFTMPGGPPGSGSYRRQAFNVASTPWRGTTILHGGNYVWPDDLWEWDGQGWAQLHVHDAPGNLIAGNACVATDTRRQRVVLFGGGHSGSLPPLRKTWLFDSGLQWRLAADSPQLDDGFETATYDPVRDEYLLIKKPRSAPLPFQTHIMPGSGMDSSLRMNASSFGPPPRDDYGIVFDPVSQQMLLFGGRSLVPLDDTWLWDGSRWVEDQRTVRPFPGYGAPAYHPGRRSIVMPIVETGAIQNRFATFEWTQARGWRQLPHANGPRGILRIVGSAYDPASGKVVAVFHIYPPISGMPYTFETWTFDGTDWTNEMPSNTPDTYQVMLVPELGGVVSIYTNDRTQPLDPHQIWRWDGSDWQRVALANLPGGERVPSHLGPVPRVFGGPMAYDGSRGTLRMFQDELMGWFCEDLRVDTLSANTHGPRIGTTWSAQIHAPSEAGNPFAIALSDNDWPALPIHWRRDLGAWRRLPLGNGPLLQASVAAGLGIGLLDANGDGRFSLPLPVDPALVGFRFHAAGVTVDASSGQIGVVTNRVTAVVQQ